MNCERYQLQIDDDADGALDAPARASLEAHLAGCAACRAALEEVQAIRRAAAALDRHVPPPQLWGRIAAAVEADSQRRWWQRAFGRHGRGAGLPQLAAAAVAIAILVGVAAMAWRDLGPALGTTGGETLVAGTTPAAAGLAPLVDEGLKLAEDEYVQAISGLEEIRELEQGQLDPDVAGVVQANLTVIDQAIVESRTALQDEPDNEVAQQSLFEALRSKVELLQNAIALVNEMRQGNQAGVAAIVSGQNQ
jgi:hypothetical protein